MRSRPARVRNSSRLSLESLEDRLAPATFTVANDNNSGPGSLRAAINAANAVPGADYIQFKIPGGGTHRIDLLSALPAITDKLTINAASEPGYAGSPLIVLNGADAGAGVSGLVVRAAGSVVRGLVINEFAVDGIRVRANNCRIAGCYVGTDEAGAVALGNGFSGVHVFAGAKNVAVGGDGQFGGNVLSGNGNAGVEIGQAAGNTVKGNVIGLSADGLSALPNALGVLLADGATKNVIGGGAGNTISGNLAAGVSIVGNGTSGNAVSGNRIGTDMSGNEARANRGNGVLIIDGAKSNVIRDNTLSGNDANGLEITGVNTTGNVATGNRIGLNAAGTTVLANDVNGVLISSGAANNTIGGNTAADRNLIAGNLQNGVLITGPGTTGNTVLGNLIGTDVTGTLDLGNAEDGVHITGGAADNLIGGADPGARNVISGNELSSIFVEGIGTTGTVIQGNYLGTDVTGTLALGNGNYGVRTLDAANTLIGGSAPGARNIISGNDLEGVFVEGAGAIGTRIQGNYVGTDVTGSAMLGNRLSGVVISRTTGVLVGGAAPGEGNVISGNGHPDPNGNSTGSGVRVTGLGSTGNVVQGNLIGTDATGTLPLGNAFMGVMLVTGATGNLIGGSTPGAGNVISSNRSNVVVIGNGTDGNVIQGNFIGTDVTGTVVLNGAVSSRVGVDLSTSSSNTVVGGVAAGERNVIAGHSIAGVYISGEPGNIVQGNYIGTDVTGTLDLGNAVGVTINNTGGNVIGGTVPGAGNLISGNSTGVLIHGADASGNLIQGNLIGTDVTSTLDLGNDNEGIRITQNASGNVIGGVEAGMDNVVACNGGQGVWIDGGSGNSVLGNSIFDNDALGIELGLEGLTPNDLNDADTGPNDLLNFPVLASAVLGGGDVLVTGSINTERFKSLRIEFFTNTETDASGHGEGEIFIGFLDVEMGDNNTVNFDVLLQGDQVEPGQFITATATDELGNTSEFSLALAVS